MEGSFSQLKIVETPPAPADFIDALPQWVLVMILQHLPLHDCLGGAAFVQRRWAAAAAAVTSNVELCISSVQQFEQLQAWLQQHGRHVITLTLSVGDYDNNGAAMPNLGLQHLPCPRLLKLHLSGLQVRLAPGQPTEHGQRQLGVLSACTGLQLLRLDRCKLADPGNDLAALSAATSLRSLSLGHLHNSAGESLMREALQQLASLTDLRSLSLNLAGIQAPLEAPHLEAVAQLRHVTSLSFEYASWSDIMGASMPLRSGLQVLHLTAVRGVQLPMLASMASLQHLSLNRCSLQPDAALSVVAGPPQLRHLSVVDMSGLCSDQHVVAHLEAWLQACGGLQELNVDHPSRINARHELTFYEALTSNTQLTTLGLHNSLATWAPYMFESLFPDGRMLPGLAVFSINLQSFDEYDAACLVCSCPALQALRLDDELTTGRSYPPLVCDGAALEVLQGLPRLQQLALGNITSLTAGQQLAKLTGLTKLETHVVTRAVCQQLTALSNLHYLKAHTGIHSGQNCLSFTNKAPAGSPPDVWRQLLDHPATKR